jgi:predicted esterase
MVLWGGGFAHDLTLEVAKEKFAATEILVVLGERDELITEESKKKQVDLLEALDKPLKLLTFPGGHELDINLLDKIIHHRF